MSSLIVLEIHDIDVMENLINQGKGWEYFYVVYGSLGPCLLTMSKSVFGVQIR